MKEVQDNTNSARICEEDDEDDDAYIARDTPKKDSSL